VALRRAASHRRQRSTHNINRARSLRRNPGPKITRNINQRTRRKGNRKLMSGHICKSREDEPASRKMPGRKMKTARASGAIFLPGIFLLSLVCVSVEAGFENAP
jgi:hypothetical protein